MPYFIKRDHDITPYDHRADNGRDGGDILHLALNPHAQRGFLVVFPEGKYVSVDVSYAELRELRDALNEADLEG